jgi:chromosome segregation ATPase
MSKPRYTPEAKNDLEEIERHLQTLKKLEEETNAKLARFKDEQFRIDSIEQDFSKLLSVSEAIRKKMGELQENDDAMQDIQLKARKFFITMEETEKKYQQIEKKNAVLEETSEGIERNFKQLREAEKTAAQFSLSLDKLSGELEQMKTAVEKITRDKAKITGAAEKVATLDEAISETNRQIDLIQKSRQWCADLESRLQELNEEAKRQAELVGKLMSGKERGRGSDEGAPSLNTRKDVLDLHRRGWSNADIARSLHLAQSTVELILESPRGA